MPRALKPEVMEECRSTDGFVLLCNNEMLVSETS